MEINKDLNLRHEYKYICSEYQIELIKNNIQLVLSLDENVSDMNSGIDQYTVKSLYFDTFDNRCMSDNADGVDNRVKYRIRYYNTNTDFIRLEKKGKYRGKTYKETCNISKSDCENIINMRLDRVENKSDPLLSHLIYLIKTEGMRPVVIVEYERIPYVYKHDNVRVTFDMNIRSSRNIKAFLTDQSKYRSVLPLGYHLLEVKWNSFIPGFIYNTININNLRWSTFSKYYICRKFSL